MKNNLRCVSKIIVKKSNGYLKVSLTIYVFILLSFSTVFLVSMKQRIQEQRNFDDNAKVHTIAIQSKVDSDYTVRTVTAEDISLIKKILLEEGYDETSYMLGPVYGITSGVIDYDTDEPYVIYGIPRESRWLMNNEVMRNDILYMRSGDYSDANLFVSIFTEESGGIAAKDAKLFLMKKYPIEASLLRLFEEKHVGLNYAYVTDETFATLFSTMNQEQITAADLVSEKLNYNTIDKLYVYVNDLYCIEKVAEILEDSSYQITYTLNAFDSLGASMKESRLFELLLMILLLVLTVVIVVLSFQSYLRIQQKDMGILKFFGYSKTKLRTIYRYYMDQMFFKIFLIVTICTIVIGVICLPMSCFYYVFLAVLILACVLFLTERIVVIGVLNRMLDKDILQLVKISKEFE